MHYTKITILAIAGALTIASAIAPADARHVRRGWTTGVLHTSAGYYGPHYGDPTYPSYWRSPTSGVYPVDPSLCYVPRGYPSYGIGYPSPYYGYWYRPWDWSLEYVC
jgi:hypothetical protein